MARPTKSVKVISQYSQTKDELKERAENEEKLKGGAVPPPPAWLTDTQKGIYTQITEYLEESEMLCVNDVWLLEKTAIAIDRIEQIEKAINSAGVEIFTKKDNGLLAVLKQYTSDFYRGCNELCLSPQARAKLANAMTAKAESKPLIDVMDSIGNL